MCLIVTGPSNKVRETLLKTPKLLEDIFEGNKDGIGAMYASDDGVVIVNKALPKDLAEAQKFVEQLPESDRDLALHFRMRTHGNIDLENCHPYPVIDGQLHMMHNGVIRGIDDSSDKTKSDTWHYIERVLKPQLQAAPHLVNVEAWRKLVARDVESNNKLVLMNAKGELATVNRGSGIEHDGMWFSNEYAWRPELLIPDYRWWGNDSWASTGSGFTWTGGSGNGTTKSTGLVRGIKPMVDADALWTAVGFADADEVYKFLDEYPISTLAILFEKDMFISSVGPRELGQQDAKIVEMLEDGDEYKLARYCRKSAGRCRKVAEVIAWYGSWVSKKDGKERTMEQTAIENATHDSQEEADHEVIEGQVVPIRQSFASDEENPDDADLATWRHSFQEWLDRQGYKDDKKVAALEKPFPTSEEKVRGFTKINYRGYTITVPDELLGRTMHRQLREFLEETVQYLHDQAVKEIAAEPPMPAEAATELGVDESHTEEAEAHSDLYAG